MKFLNKMRKTMKKTFLILVILTMVYSVFARGSSENTEQGTYIPLAMYEAVEETKSYSEGIALTSSKEYYTVLCVTENKILSDLKFHDAFQLSKDEIDFSFSSKNGKRFLTDNNTGIEYIKISDSTDYNAAYNDFLFNTVMKALAKENPKELAQLEAFEKVFSENGGFTKEFFIAQRGFMAVATKYLSKNSKPFPFKETLASPLLNFKEKLFI